MTTRKLAAALSVLGLVVLLIGCGKNKPGAEGSDGPAGSGESVSDRDGEFKSPDGGLAANPDGDRPPINEGDDEWNRMVERQLQDVFYDFDKSDIRADGRAALAHDATVLKEYEAAKIFIEGHCDERGTNEYNLALGERRARAARDYLVDAGISAERMLIISYGEEKPFSMGHDETSWQLNRRAHFKVRGK